MHRRSMSALLVAAGCLATPTAASAQIEFIADHRWIYNSYQVITFDPVSGFPISEQYDSDRLDALDGWLFDPFDVSISLEHAPAPGERWAVEVTQDSYFTDLGLFGSGTAVFEEGAANPPCNDFYRSDLAATNRVVTWFTANEPCRVRVEVSFDAPEGLEIRADLEPKLFASEDLFSETLIGGDPVTVSQEIWMPYPGFDFEWRVAFAESIRCRQGERLEVSFDSSIEVLPDCNAADFAAPHGVLDLADVQDFVGYFASGAPEADVAEPLGVFDLADLASFVVSFNGGCD